MTQGIWRGTVTRVHPDGTADVSVQRLSGTHEYGPCDVVEFPGTAGLRTEASGHDHGLRPVANRLAAGNRVLVALLEGDPNRPAIIGRLAT